MATPDTDKSRRNTTTTDDDEEVIGKCSFFYNNAPISNEEDDSYSDQLSTIEQYHRRSQQSRLNPRAMAQAIKTQATSALFCLKKAKIDAVSISIRVAFFVL